MKTTIIIGIVATVCVSAALIWTSGGSAQALTSIREDLLYPVRRGDLHVTITEHGTLVAAESQALSSGTDRRHEITYLVEEGLVVEEGEVLARLDGTEDERAVERLELDIVQAEADLNTAQTELEIHTADNLSTVGKATFAVEKAKNELLRYEEGDAPNERRKKNVAVKEKETAFSRARKRYEDSQTLFGLDYIIESQLEQDEIGFEKATVDRESAKLDLEIFEKFTFPMTTVERKNAVDDAKRDLENAEKRALSTMRQKEVAVEQVEKRLTKLGEQLEDTREEIEKLTVVAPSPGIVLYGDPDEPWYRNDVKVGGTMHGRTTIFTIPDLRVMQVKLWVHEADINKLNELQGAKITMDTFPGLVLDGEVEKIASIAGSPDQWDRNPDVKRFEVDVTITGASEVRLKPGISAKAEIFIEDKLDVLHVPIQSVFLEEGQHYCYVVGDRGLPERRRVKPGSGNDTHLEIMEGLEEGDRVLLFNPDLPSMASDEDASEAVEAVATEPMTGAQTP